jgi:hypothetical protein
MKTVKLFNDLGEVLVNCCIVFRMVLVANTQNITLTMGCRTCIMNWMMEIYNADLESKDYCT